ncbi:uncharacterized protein PgNI_08808 [Pyricularia grisea]|uniref:Uncharacterized protein n=1 Tax=Pyricularia grisea TaxID=148305 RepID=A0A6P8AWG6_PYRGI|nr:uncharacterized protein PgNI_08808 [Pyricularia grisea]TLD06581.1 hypothetical protein PgNI_08808 [Pyricularia grisea]
MATMVQEFGNFMPESTLESTTSIHAYTRMPWEEEARYTHDIQSDPTMSFNSGNTWRPARTNDDAPPPLKRRRAYGPVPSAAEPAYQGPTSSPEMPNTQASAMTPHNSQFILEQAARILQVPVPQLLQLGQTRESPETPSIVNQAALTLDVPVSSLFELQERHRHKRLRVETPGASPSTYVERGAGLGGGAKAMQGSRQGSDDNSEHYSWAAMTASPQPPTYLGLSGPRIANAFASFPTYDSHESYQNSQDDHHIRVTTAPHCYGGTRVTSMGTSPTPANLPTTPVTGYDNGTSITHSNQAGPVVSDAPLMVDNYMTSFAALPHPRHIPFDQQTVNKPVMYYQGNAASSIYSRPASNDQHTAAVVPMHPRVHVMENVPGYRPYQNSPETQSPSSSHAGAADDVSLGYDVFPAYVPQAHLVDNSAAPIEFYTRPQDFELIYSTHRAPPAKRGPFKDRGERDLTAETRKCNIDINDRKGCCLTCKKVANTSKVWRLPCLRLKINNIVLSKIGQVRGFEWTSRWKDSTVADDISSWASLETRTIHVTEGFTGSSIALRVRQFIPQAGDSLERSWVGPDGTKRSVHIPHFAVVDMDATKVGLDKYIRGGIWEMCKKVIGPNKALIWNTYALALKRANDSGVDKKEQELLKSTLELWMSIRLTTNSFEIVGEETLGMPQDIMDETSPLCGKIPLPPVLGAQLDSILIHQIQAKFRHDTLELLQKMTQENKARTWLTTYLVTFILLHNIALVIKHDAGYARKHGMQRRFAREDKVREYYMGATTLLAYSHYRGGSKIFASDVRDDDLRLHSGEDGASLIAFTRRCAKESERDWKNLLNNSDIENEYFFISQLYEQNWMPREWPF